MHHTSIVATNGTDLNIMASYNQFENHFLKYINTNQYNNAQFYRYIFHF